MPARRRDRSAPTARQSAMNVVLQEPTWPCSRRRPQLAVQRNRERPLIQRMTGSSGSEADVCESCSDDAKSGTRLTTGDNSAWC